MHQSAKMKNSGEFPAGGNCATAPEQGGRLAGSPPVTLDAPDAARF